MHLSVAALVAFLTATPVYAQGFAAVEAEFVVQLAKDAPANVTEWTAEVPARCRLRQPGGPARRRGRCRPRGVRAVRRWTRAGRSRGSRPGAT